MSKADVRANDEAIGAGAVKNEEVARAAGLRYVSDRAPGIRRCRRGKGFYYLGPSGKPVRDEATLGRIGALVIPPAWEEVWICALENGHIQAVGKDQRGRKQYRYHARWRDVRDESKYDRLIDFARALPKIRRRVARDIKRAGLSREKVLATVVELLEQTHIRIGNEKYVEENHSFGLTTMRDRHVSVNGYTIHFEFRGKSGVEHAIDLQDQRLAKIVKACQDLPGQELFQYLDGDGSRHDIGSQDVNAYLHEIVGNDFTAKDFRTWAGTVLAAVTLRKIGPCDTKAQTKRNLVAAISQVAGHLGNTRAVCKKCYIHPAILAAYEQGTLHETLERCEESGGRLVFKALRCDEMAVATLLCAHKSNGHRGNGGKKHG